MPFYLMLTVLAENNAAFCVRVQNIFFVLFLLLIYINFCSPPGSPTTLGFFPAASSLSSPAGLVRMPGLAYNGSGVKELINAVQGYQVRTSSLPMHPIYLITYICSAHTRSHAPVFCLIQISSDGCVPSGIHCGCFRLSN